MQDTVALIEASGLTILEDEIIDVPWVFVDVEEAAFFASAAVRNWTRQRVRNRRTRFRATLG